MQRRAARTKVPVGDAQSAKIAWSPPAPPRKPGDRLPPWRTVPPGQAATPMSSFAHFLPFPAAGLRGVVSCDAIGTLVWTSSSKARILQTAQVTRLGLSPFPTLTLREYVNIFILRR